jgi:hypothetical protein
MFAFHKSMGEQFNKNSPEQSPHSIAYQDMNLGGTSALGDEPSTKYRKHAPGHGGH